MIDLNQFTKEECEKIATLIRGAEVKNSTGWFEQSRDNIRFNPKAEWENRLRLEFKLDGSEAGKLGDFHINIYEDGRIEYQNWNGCNLEMRNLLEVYQLIIKKFQING